MRKRTPEENREKSRRHVAHCRAHGLCFRCQKRLDCGSRQHCRACLVLKRDYRRRYGGHAAQLKDHELSNRLTRREDT